MKIFRFGLSTGFVFWALVPSLLSAGEATNQLSGTMNAFMPMVTNTTQLVLARFDFAEMARRSLGPHWRSLDQGEQKQFVEGFAERLMGYYDGIVRSAGGEKIRFKREVQDGKYASVETQVITRYGEDLPIKYWLEDVDGQWKVYDVVIDHVGVVENFRVQFERVIAKSSVKELLQKLKDRNPGS